MPGIRVTDQQVRLYMSIRKNNKSQALAAAKAGISERSARRIESSTALPSQSPRRYWRSRVDPFAQVWDTEVVPLLRGAPKLMAITLLRKLQDDHPELFPDGVLRTLQRHIRQWRALEGPPKEVFFPQDHAPGHRGLSDFTAMGELRITIANAPFAHILYHFVLAFSRWEHVEVVEGGESFEALSKGLQNALWQAGGAPQEHRSDSLSAAFKNLAEEEDFTVRYTALLDHYGMVGTRNNRGVSHENGSVESSHRYLKEAIEQALLLRGHRDFEDRLAYEGFVREAVMRRNRRNAAAFRIEREQLQDLPQRRTTDFVEEEARVTRCGTFTRAGHPVQRALTPDRPPPEGAAVQRQAGLLPLGGARAHAGTRCALSAQRARPDDRLPALHRRPQAQAPGVQGPGVPRCAVPARRVPPDVGATRPEADPATGLPDHRCPP